MVNYLGEEDMQNTYFFGGPSGRISNEYYRADIDTMEPVEPENVGTLYVSKNCKTKPYTL